MNIDALREQYEALWEKGASMEQIMEFCRCHLEPVKKNGRMEVPLVSILQSSRTWGEMVLMPFFLRHMRDDDLRLLQVLALYMTSKRGNLWSIESSRRISRLLSRNDILPAGTRAFFWIMLQNTPMPFYYCTLEEEDIALVDKVEVRQGIVQRRLPGHERIPPGIFFLDKRHPPPSETMKQVIQADSASLFEMEITLTGKRISFGLLQAVIRSNALGILTHLLQRCPERVAAILSPLDLLICLLAMTTMLFDQPERGVCFLNALEEAFPGTCRRIDGLGNSPLWYCLYLHNPHQREKEARQREIIAQALMDRGADPDSLNHLNLSYRICAEAQKLWY